MNPENQPENKPTQETKELLCPEAGTATSSPDVLTTFPTILNVMLWMKKEAYEETTIKQQPND